MTPNHLVDTIVYKHVLKQGMNRVSVPLGTQFMSIITQNDNIVLYGLQPLEDLSLGTIERLVYVAATGERMAYGTSQLIFIGTVQFTSGIERGLVFHAFELLASPTMVKAQ